jgi:hypothetical protein
MQNYTKSMQAENGNSPVRKGPAGNPCKTKASRPAEKFPVAITDGLLKNNS